jgi:hypothetical protein
MSRRRLAIPVQITSQHGRDSVPKIYRLSPALIAFAIVVAATEIARGQQNLFNVPSAEITPPAKLFFQQQVNFDHGAQSNTSIAYGMGDGFEVGMNVLQFGIIPEDAFPAIPLFLVNTQKGVEVNEFFKFGVGTQIGESVPLREDDVGFANFSYWTNVFMLPDDRAKLYIGPYFANSFYRGNRGNAFGYMLGFDIPIVKDHFSLMGDYISGDSGISLAVLGGVLNLSEHWQLSLGAQLPSPHSQNTYGGVLELTFLPGGSTGKAGDDPPGAESPPGGGLAQWFRRGLVTR